MDQKEKQMTIGEFGASIKKKYSQYSGYSDEDIGNKMLAKYPQYNSKIIIPEIPHRSLSQKVLDVGSGVANFFGAKGISDQFGSSIARANIPGAEKLGIPKQTEQGKELVGNPSLKNVIGSAIQTGANLIPGAAEGAGFLGKVAVGAGTGYAVDIGNKLQQNKSIAESATPGVGTAVGAALPVAGAVIKPATAIIGRLLKGLGSGLSGVSTKTIDSIVSNPQTAMEASQKLAKSGNAKVLEENAKQIINGVSTIRNQARKSFGEGLDKLAETDIKPEVFRQNTQQVLDKYGSVMQDGKRALTNVEFNDPKNIQKASDLVDRLSNSKLDGKSLRKLSDDIENSAYKVATSDERLSFNNFVRDLSGGLKDAISKSTDKLGEINNKFSQDMQLTEAMQNIFGKVNYKNLPEVVKASQRLEGLFAQKGLAPDVVDRFFERLGVKPADFRTTEAVRQISDKSSGANTKGLSVGEMMQQATSAIVTPKMIKNLSITTGLAKESLLPFLKKMKPSARNILIQALIQSDQTDSEGNR